MNTFPVNIKYMRNLKWNDEIINKVIDKLDVYLTQYTCGVSVCQSDSGQTEAIDLMGDIADITYEINPENIENE